MEESYLIINNKKFMLVPTDKLPEDENQKRKVLDDMLDDHIHGRSKYPLFESPHDALFFARNAIHSKRLNNNIYEVYRVNLLYDLSLGEVKDDCVDKMPMEKIKN